MLGDKERMMKMTRRDFMAGAGALAGLGLAGCGTFADKWLSRARHSTYWCTWGTQAETLKDHQVTGELIRCARENGIAYAADVYPHYGSDADAALAAGYDLRHGLIGAGVYASHGYERAHRDGAENTP